MKTGRLLYLALLHAYGDITIDEEAVALEFCTKKNNINFNYSNSSFQLEIKAPLAVDILPTM